MAKQDRRLWPQRAAALLALAGLAASSAPARADALIAARSAGTVDALLDRVQTYAVAKGFTIVARVDHSGAAAGAGLALRPTKLLIFGNPKGGTPVMQCDQRVGLDLPLKALAWQDADGQVWLGMADPLLLNARYDLGAACAGALSAMSQAAHRLVETVANP